MSLRALHQGLESLPKLRHRELLQETLAMASAGAESILEARYMKDVERAHGLPRGWRQVSVSHGTRTDVGYEDQQLLVELDGRLGHTGPGAFRDAERDNLHTTYGWATLRFGWRDVTQNPCRVALLVSDTLINRGWTGAMRRCRRCR